jgi:hypothetical protein
MTNELWLAVLSSSLISGVLGAFIAGWFNLRVKGNEYANAYYRIVLDRRLAAYEGIERLISAIKIAVVDKDKRPYHFLLSKDDDHVAVYKLLFEVMSQSLWLSDDLFQKTRELNLLVYTAPQGTSGLVEFGKKNYLAIGEIRTQIEKMHARDMLTLHKVPLFLKRKRHTDTYSALPEQG